jgi:cobalt-precorrin-6B (C15)-methyltransferase
MKVSGGPTQDEVMAISLFKLDLKEGDVIADIGCGTGKVSIEASRTCDRVYAIDVRDEAITATNYNVAENSADKVKVVKGNAKEVLPGLGRLNGAFIGGSQDLDETIRILSQQVTGRIVVNAVLFRTLQQAMSTMQDLGIFEEVIQVSVSRSYPLSGSFIFRPIDPVYIIVGRCK